MVSDLEPVPEVNDFGTPYWMLLNLTHAEVDRLRELVGARVEAGVSLDEVDRQLLGDLRDPIAQEIGEFQICAIGVGRPRRDRLWGAVVVLAVVTAVFSQLVAWSYRRVALDSIEQVESVTDRLEQRNVVGFPPIEESPVWVWNEETGEFDCVPGGDDPTVCDEEDP